MRGVESKQEREGRKGGGRIEVFCPRQCRQTLRYPFSLRLGLESCSEGERRVVPVMGECGRLGGALWGGEGGRKDVGRGKMPQGISGYSVAHDDGTSGSSNSRQNNCSSRYKEFNFSEFLVCFILFFLILSFFGKLFGFFYHAMCNYFQGGIFFH